MSRPQPDCGSGPRRDVLGAVKHRVRQTLVLDAWRFSTSLLNAVRWRAALGEVETYCLFIGHGRSGHSIVGSLLDAHPEAIVSDELDAVRYISLGFRRDQLLALSLERSLHQARGQRRKAGRGGRTYTYLVPGGMNGRFDRLRLVGDTRAGGTVHRLRQQPELVERIDRRFRGISVRYVHVVRNPYDNISTMTIRRDRELDEAISAYFADCQALAMIRGRIGRERLFELRHEDLIGAPHVRLADLCRFLSLPVTNDYLAACARILFHSPSRSRESIVWSQQQIDQVAKQIERFPFLTGYSFAE
jgi:hypothetical protein